MHYELRKQQFRFAQRFAIALVVVFLVALVATYYVFEEINTMNQKSAKLVADQTARSEQILSQILKESAKAEKELSRIKKKL